MSDRTRRRGEEPENRIDLECLMQVFSTKTAKKSVQGTKDVWIMRFERTSLSTIKRATIEHLSRQNR